MIAQLLELIKSLGSYALPFVVIDAWQAAVVLRFGRYERSLGPGFYWKLPFIQTVIAHSVAVTTTSLSAQSVEDPDGKIYTAECVVRWKIEDIKPYACEIWDGENVIIDSAKSAIAKTIRTEGTAVLDGKVTNLSRRALKKYGICVEEITITTLAPVKCLRLICSRVGAEQPPSYTE